MACRTADPPSPRGGLEVADIFRQFGRAYRVDRAIGWAQRKVMWAIESCRTSILGGHKDRCGSCGEVRYAYSSCRDRHCPKCQTLTKEQWLEDRRAELLPIPYFHCVFTLPHALNPLVLCNKAILLKVLFGAASETLLTFGRNNLGGKMGFTMVLHTWDQLLRSHFHVHCVVPAGALGHDRERWIKGDARYLFPVQALSKVFRGKYLDGLRRAHANGDLHLPSDVGGGDPVNGFENLLQRLQTIDWVVFAKRPFAGPEQVLGYLGRYTHRVAISNNRITDISDSEVSFTYRDRRKGDQECTATVPAEEFISRFLLHVLPKGFMRIRHYGFLANRSKRADLACCRALLGQPAAPPERRRLALDERVLKLTGIDIHCCPSCGARGLLRTRVKPSLPALMALPCETRDTS